MRPFSCSIFSFAERRSRSVASAITFDFFFFDFAAAKGISNFCRNNSQDRQLSDRAFHLQLDQAFELDAVFHGELADEIVDESVYAQAHSLRFAQTALLHVEDLFGADLADAGFV